MSTKKKVYTFYISAVLLMVLVLTFFNLSIVAKGILCLLIVFCILVMRSIQTAYHLPDDIDPDTMQPVTVELKSSDVIQNREMGHNTNIDLYLCLLIDVDEELAKDPNVNQDSPSYNIQLNNRIAERLESLENVDRIK